MSSQDEPGRRGITELTAEIVAAYVANNTLEPDQVGKLTHAVGQDLRKVHQGRIEGVHHGTGSTPAVKPSKSVANDYLICLECGRKQKMLKRHLANAHDLTPDAYREKHGLRADYPMVAPNYTKRRTEIAKEIGLGQRGRARSRAA